MFLSFRLILHKNTPPNWLEEINYSLSGKKTYQSKITISQYWIIFKHLLMAFLLPSPDILTWYFKNFQSSLNWLFLYSLINLGQRILRWHQLSKTISTRYSWICQRRWWMIKSAQKVKMYLSLLHRVRHDAYLIGEKETEVKVSREKLLVRGKFSHQCLKLLAFLRLNLWVR